MSDIFTLPPGKLLLRLLSPIAFGFMMLMFIDFADILVAGMISDEAVAVLGYCYALIYFMISIGVGLNQGLTIVGSAAYQSQDKKSLYHLLAQASFLAILMSLLLVALTGLFLYFKWVDEEILRYFFMLKPYLLIILLGVLPTFLLLLVCAISQVQGRPEIIRDTLASMLCLTFILHPICALSTGRYLGAVLPSGMKAGVELPLGFNLGLAGIALSKLIVTLVGLIYAAMRAIDWKCFWQSNLGIRYHGLRVVASQAFPAACIQLMVPIYLMMLTKVVTSYGIQAVAGFALGYRIVMVVVIPILGVLVALLVVLSHDIVLKQYDRVKEVLWLSIRWGSVIVLLVLCMSYIVADVFFWQSARGQMEIIALQYLQLAMYITVLEYMMGVFTVSFQAIKKPAQAFLLQALRTVIFPAPILYWAYAYAITLEQLWYSIALSFTLAWISCLGISYFSFWRKELRQV